MSGAQDHSAPPAGRHVIENGRKVRLPSIMAALSYALDLTEGQAMGHSAHCCLIGMKIADELDLPQPAKEALYYGLLLKDAGCSSNASRLYHTLLSDEREAKRQARTAERACPIDSLQFLRRNMLPDRPTHERLAGMLKAVLNGKERKRILVKTRCERGALIVQKMGFPPETADAIGSLDERWDGKGHPEQLRGEQIPQAARIAGMAQTLAIFSSLEGPGRALEVVRRRSGKWFDPGLVRLVLTWNANDPVLQSPDEDSANLAVSERAPEGESVVVDEDRLDSICEAFADVIDAKSPFTSRHSVGVAATALRVGREMDLSGRDRTTLRRAALLHDIGKLSVPNSILEKPGPLTDREWETMKLHPYYSQRILERVPVFRRFAPVAAAHHEKLDGSGYHRGLAAEGLSQSARILAVADIFDALTADRPYRSGLAVERAFELIEREVPAKLDRDCYDALLASCREPLEDDARGLACLIDMDAAVADSGRGASPERPAPAQARPGRVGSV